MLALKPALIRAFALTVAMGSIASAQVVQPYMVGHWKGEAQIFVNWTKAKTLPVDIVIGRDDRVTGMIGDAKLVDARFGSNRRWLSVQLRWKTAYIIEGSLDGAVIAAENIRRERAMLPLNWNEDRFEGGVNTSGTEAGGADSMVLAAGRLVLHHVPDSVVCVVAMCGRHQ
jgi:hypothetical protein